MESRIMKNGKRFAALGLCGAVFAGCVFEGDQQVAQPGPSPIPSMQCGDVSAAQQQKGDSLVALAQRIQIGDVEMMVSGSEWNTVGDDRARAALGYYNQALAAAPGHCGALFGRALTQGQMLIQDQALNTVVSQALAKSSGGSAESGQASMPLAKAFKASPDEAAPLVLRVMSGMSQVDKPFISAQQDRFANELLPVLDSIIASLDAVLAHGDFAITFPTAEGGVIEIDAGEVGPVLGGLKVARAVVLVLSGYQWEIAKDGSYDWMDHVTDLQPSSFRNLTVVERSDMDHLTGLFRAGSPFTRVKPAWKASIQGIPNLLLQAVENAQTGLRYSLWEASHPEKQINDVYRVGTGESDDIDPKDLEGVIDALERTKKYLKGEVALEYHNGTHTLKLNFTKVFSWDGLQNFLPYHKVAPYETWFAPLAAAETEEIGFAGPTNGDSRAKIFSVLGYANSDAVGFLETNTGYQLLLHHEEDSWFGDGYTGPDVVLASLTQGAAPCTFNFVKHAGRHRVEPTLLFPDAASFVLTSETGSGVIDLKGSCRETAEGREYFTIRYGGEPAPFHFTDAAGNKTLDIHQLEAIVDDLGLAALTGKVVFPDPTFGGVFPGLNNDNIWSTMQSLDAVGPRINETCDENGNCTRELPNNPSDLDVWAHYLFWVDNLF
jgi:hypothetical protein